jgi:hypothetical protein
MSVSGAVPCALPSALLALVALLASCAAPSETAVALVLTPASVTLARYDSIQFQGSQHVARWSIVEGPAGGSISDAGAYIAPERDGVFHVSAEGSSGEVAEAEVTVVTRDLHDTGGPVMSQPVVYAIFWGDLSALPANIVTNVTDFFQGIGASPYLGGLSQYLRGVPAGLAFGGAFIDQTSSPPSKTPTLFDVDMEVCKVLQAHGVGPSRNAIYVVYGSTPAQPDHQLGADCGWHGFFGFGCLGNDLTVAYVGSSASTDGACVRSAEPSCNSLSPDATTMIASTAHELVETMTDVHPGTTQQAWMDVANDEVADKCGFAPEQCIQVAPGVSFMLPALYSNATHTCVYR